MRAGRSMRPATSMQYNMRQRACLMAIYILCELPRCGVALGFDHDSNPRADRAAGLIRCSSGSCGC